MLSQLHMPAVLVASLLLSPAVGNSADGVQPVDCSGKLATIVGTDGDDTLVGTPGRDVIVGLRGNDWIFGGEGDDVLCGDRGHDLLRGGAGDDVLYGDRGRDRLRGGSDADSLYGGPSNDLIDGGPGDDYLQGNPRPDEEGFAGPAAADRLAFSIAPRGVTVDLEAGTATGHGKDVLADQTWWVYGSRYGDHVSGSGRMERLYGGNGADVIDGGGGRDCLWGDGDDQASDRLLGGSGKDCLSAGGGGDVLFGGDGDDGLSDSGRRGHDRLYGEAGDDYLEDVFVAGAGQVISGGAGSNSGRLKARLLVDGKPRYPLIVTHLGAGTTTVDSEVSAHVETSGLSGIILWRGPWLVYGTDDAESFAVEYGGPVFAYAGGGDDLLGGSDEDDYLDGGAGTDQAYTGAGRDICVSVEDPYDEPCEVVSDSSLPPPS